MCDNYVYVDDQGFQASAGDVKPYGVIVISKHFALILYDDAVNTSISGGSMSNNGFTFIYEQGMGKPAYKVAQIMPTRYFSNAFAKLYNVCPSGVVALSDRVLATYEGSLKMTAIDADQIVFQGLAPVAAFGVHESSGPTLFIGSEPYSDAWYNTVAYAIKHDTYYGRLPKTDGFVLTDNTTTKIKKAVSEMKTFATLSDAASFLLSKPPVGAGTAIQGTIISVVTPDALSDVPGESIEVEDGIISEPKLISVLETGAFESLNHTPDSAFEWFSLKNDFGDLIKKYNEQYELALKNALKVTYNQLIAISQVVRDAIDGQWKDNFREAAQDQYLKSRDSLNKRVKEQIQGADQDTNYKAMLEKYTTDAGLTIDDTDLDNLGVQLPGECYVPALDESSKMFNADVIYQVNTLAPYYISQWFAKKIQDTDDTSMLVDIVTAALNTEDMSYMDAGVKQQLMDGAALKAGVSAQVGAVARARVTDTFSSSSKIGLCLKMASNLEALDDAESDQFGWDGWYYHNCFAKSFRHQRTYIGYKDGSQDSHVPFNELAQRVIFGPSEMFVSELDNKVYFRTTVYCGMISAFQTRVDLGTASRQQNIIMNKVFDGLRVDHLGVTDAPNPGAFGEQYGGSPNGNSRQAYWTLPWTKHLVYSEGSSVEPIIVPTPTPAQIWTALGITEQAYVNKVAPKASDVASGAGYLISEGASKLASQSALAVIQPMLDDIKVVAQQTALIEVAGAVTTLVDICKVGTVSEEYIKGILDLLDTVKTKMSPETFSKLESFAKIVQGFLFQKKQSPLYYTTAASYITGARYADRNGVGYAITYGSDYNI